MLKESLSQQSTQNNTERKYVPNCCKHLLIKTLLVILKCVERDVKVACNHRSLSVSIVT
jgi:hypothetical protein